MQLLCPANKRKSKAVPNQPQSHKQVKDKLFSHPDKMRKEKGSNLLMVLTVWFSTTDEIKSIKISHLRAISFTRGQTSGTAAWTTGMGMQILYRPIILEAITKTIIMMICRLHSNRCIVRQIHQGGNRKWIKDHLLNSKNSQILWIYADHQVEWTMLIVKMDRRWWIKIRQLFQE